MKAACEKNHEDVLEDAEKSEQDKKTYLIGIINEVTTVMPKLDTKQLNTPTSSDYKDDDADSAGRVKEGGV